MFEQDLLKLILHRVSLQDFRTKKLLPIESFQACRTKNVTPTEPLGVFLPKYGLKRRVSFRVCGFHLVFVSNQYQSSCFKNIGRTDSELSSLLNFIMLELVSLLPSGKLFAIEYGYL